MAEENKSNTNTSNGGSRPNFNRGQGNQQRGGGDRRNNFRRDRPQRNDRVIEEKVWVPKTKLGVDVLAGKYASIDDVLRSGQQIIEPEITDFLLPNIEMDFINVGQAKGKFGGGKRKIAKATQKVTREGSQMSFAMITVCGNRDGIVGLGFGKARETVPSREKAVKNCKKNMIMFRRGCGDWGASNKNTNSIPFSVIGRSGSVEIKLIPAPPGTGLVVEAEVKKMLGLAGIKDVWSKTRGSTKNKNNLMKATFNALKELQKVKLNPKMMENRVIREGNKDE
jgi:small subunit ribosomal protein S5